MELSEIVSTAGGQADASAADARAAVLGDTTAAPTAPMPRRPQPATTYEQCDDCGAPVDDRSALLRRLRGASPQRQRSRPRAT